MRVLFRLLVIGLVCGQAALLSAADPWLGELVFWKSGAQPKVGNTKIDPELIPFPSRVEDVQGDWLWLGRAWIRKQDVHRTQQALDYYTDQIRSNPRSAAAYRARGSVWDTKGELENAIRDYTEAIRLDPKSATTYNNRGVAFASKQDYDSAIKDYTEAIRLDPKFAAAYNNRGVAFRNKQDYDSAIKDYTEAIRLDPKYATAYNNRGNAFRNKQDYDSAIKDYTEAIRLDPKDAFSSIVLGLAHLLQRTGKPLEHFRRAIEVDGGTGSWSAYSVIYGHLAARLLKDADAAQAFLKEGNRLKPEWPTPTLGFLQGETDEATYLALADTNDKRTEAHCFLGMKALADGDRTAAKEHFAWVRDNGNKNYLEYVVAIDILRRLEAAK